jgi:hypothetical protein
MSTRRQFTSSALRALALLGLVLTLAVTALTTTPAYAAKTPSGITPGKAGVLNVVAQDTVTKQAVASAAIQVWNQNGVLLLKGYTNVKGYFEATLPQGAYKLEVSGTNYESYTEAFKIAVSQTTYLEAAMTPTSQVGKFGLYVGDPIKGTAIAGADVLIWNVFRDILIEGKTNERGQFSAELPQGEYELQVMATDYKLHEDKFLIKGGTETSHEAMLEAIPKQLGVLTMQVVDAIGKGPLYEALVYIYTADGQLVEKGLTGKHGDFTVALPAGYYKVEVSMDGYSPYKEGVDISAGNETYLEVNLAP